MTVTEVRTGNTTLIMFGFLKQVATDTAADKMVRVIAAEVRNIIL